MILVRRVVGDSMLPTLPAGTIVVALKSPIRIVPGTIVIVWHEGREKIKRVHAVEGARVYLLGDNPAASTDSRTFGWLNQDAVLGRVWWPRGW